MRLAICDDNELERRILHSLLKKYFSEASISCEFTLYDHGTTLYYDIMDGMEFDIIFLDLFMEDSFGLTIAKSLRELFYRILHRQRRLCTGKLQRLCLRIYRKAVPD